MSRVFRWIGKGLGVFLGLLIVAAIILYVVSDASLNRTYSISVEPLTVPTDAASVERGKHLVNSIGFCHDCHGEKLEGKVMADDLITGRLIAPNLTTGKGGMANKLTDADWVRAIRHGVAPNGKSLIVMASNIFTHFGDADLTAMIAYVKSVPPVDNELPEIQIGPLGRLYLVMQPDVLAAQVIDHTRSRPAAPPPGRTAEYGQYLSFICRTCHGDDLGGKEGEGGGMNLTPGGDLAKWTEADFVHALRTGETLEGRKLDNEKMPWRAIGQLTDDEIGALWLYLKSLPAIETKYPTPTIEGKPK
jgi:mono/diheme cytochrome c family protein